MYCTNLDRLIAFVRMSRRELNPRNFYGSQLFTFIGLLIIIFSLFSTGYHLDKLFAQSESSSSNPEEQLLDNPEDIQLNPDYRRTWIFFRF